MAMSSFDLRTALSAVRQSVKQLNSSDRCSEALAKMGEAIAGSQDDILDANTLDLELSRDMAVPEMVVDWLKLTPERVQTSASILSRLSAVGTAFPGADVGDSDNDYYRTCPLGIVGFIYEAFPDLGAIAAGLCIRTGNALVLKGGGEASHTNQIIADILRNSLEDVGLNPDLILPIASTAEISRVEIAQSPEIDLIIPHGRPSLVEQVARQASGRVIPSRIGNCYLYWSSSGNIDRVYQMIIESHTGTPDAVNRIEKIIIHESHTENTITRLWSRLQEAGFSIRVTRKALRPEAVGSLESYSGGNTGVTVETTEPPEWDKAYLKRTLAFRSVKDTAAAIGWINTHSSGHADSIATADYAESRQFMLGCRSASVYINASPQFVRNAKRTGEIALGVSDYKGATGGLIGVSVMRERQRIFHGS